MLLLQMLEGWELQLFIPNHATPVVIKARRVRKGRATVAIDAPDEVRVFRRKSVYRDKEGKANG